MSVLKLMLLLLIVTAVVVADVLQDMFEGSVRFGPPTRIRRLSLGMSKGRSPKSTEVALPDPPEF